MKLICYILLILLIPAIPVGAQTLSGGQVQVSNQSILISDNGQVMIGMDITLPAAMELSSNCVATLTPVLKTSAAWPPCPPWWTRPPRWGTRWHWTSWPIRPGSWRTWLWPPCAACHCGKRRFRCISAAVCC